MAGSVARVGEDELISVAEAGDLVLPHAACEGEGGEKEDGLALAGREEFDFKAQGCGEGFSFQQVFNGWIVAGFGGRFRCGGWRVRGGVNPGSKPGNQIHHSLPGTHEDLKTPTPRPLWIPASAGMTE